MVGYLAGDAYDECGMPPPVWLYPMVVVGCGIPAALKFICTGGGTPDPKPIPVAVDGTESKWKTTSFPSIINKITNESKKNLIC